MLELPSASDVGRFDSSGDVVSASGARGEVGEPEVASRCRSRTARDHHPVADVHDDGRRSTAGTGTDESSSGQPWRASTQQLEHKGQVDVDEPCDDIDSDRSASGASSANASVTDLVSLHGRLCIVPTKPCARDAAPASISSTTTNCTHTNSTPPLDATASSFSFCSTTPALAYSLSSIRSTRDRFDPTATPTPATRSPPLLTPLDAPLFSEHSPAPASRDYFNHRCIASTPPRASPPGDCSNGDHCLIPAHSPSRSSHVEPFRYVLTTPTRSGQCWTPTVEADDFDFVFDLSDIDASSESDTPPPTRRQSAPTPAPASAAAPSQPAPKRKRDRRGYQIPTSQQAWTMMIDERATYGIRPDDDPWSQVPDPSDPIATARAYFDHFLQDNGGMRKENDGEPRRYANIFFDFRRGRSKYYRDVLGIDNGKVSTFASQDWQLIKNTEYGRKYWKQVADETARLYDTKFPGQRQRQPSYPAARPAPPRLSIPTAETGGMPSVLAPPLPQASPISHGSSAVSPHSVPISPHANAHPHPQSHAHALGGTAPQYPSPSRPQTIKRRTSQQFQSSPIRSRFPSNASITSPPPGVAASLPSSRLMPRYAPYSMPAGARPSAVRAPSTPSSYSFDSNSYLHPAPMMHQQQHAGTEVYPPRSLSMDPAAPGMSAGLAPPAPHPLVQRHSVDMGVLAYDQNSYSPSTSSYTPLVSTAPPPHTYHTVPGAALTPSFGSYTLAPEAINPFEYAMTAYPPASYSFEPSPTAPACGDAIGIDPRLLPSAYSQSNVQIVSPTSTPSALPGAGTDLVDSYLDWAGFEMQVTAPQA